MKDKRDYQICRRCVMDTTAEEITFNKDGICSFCHIFDNKIRSRWFPDDEGKKKLSELLKTVKEHGKDKEYDCVMGLSGGVDSSYVAYLAKREWKLRPLIFHVDSGWNTETATRNIENLVKALDLDLFTYVVDWEEMRDLQLAFLRSGVASQDSPQDHVFSAVLYKYANQYDVKYALTGDNYATESILPKSWGYTPFDKTQLMGIHKRFGTIDLRTYPTITLMQKYFYYPFVKGIKKIRPLDYIPYVKSEAIATLEREAGWRNYDYKHGESIFTRFLQTYFLPKRYGYDKRRAHLSSLILSGQTTREDAIKELQRPPCDEKEAERLKKCVAKKLRISAEELEGFLTLPKRTYRDFPNQSCILKLFKLFDHCLPKRPAGI